MQPPDRRPLKPVPLPSRRCGGGSSQPVSPLPAACHYAATQSLLAPNSLTLTTTEQCLFQAGVNFSLAAAGTCPQVARAAGKPRHGSLPHSSRQRCRRFIQAPVTVSPNAACCSRKPRASRCRFDAEDARPHPVDATTPWFNTISGGTPGGRAASLPERRVPPLCHSRTDPIHARIFYRNA